MLQNYFIVALRNFRRHKSFTLINVIGLAFGITCALLIYLLLALHTSFEKHHHQADNTYRLVTNLYFDQVLKTPGVPLPFVNAVREELPEIDQASIYHDMWDIMVMVEENGEKKKFQFEEMRGAFVEPSFFKIFDYQWISGDESVLSEPNKAVITQSIATQIFGGQDPIGRQIKVDNEEDYIIAGVVADIPENTDLRATVLCSFATFATNPKNKENLTEWGGVSSDNQCYVTLTAGKTPEDLEKALIVFNNKHHEHDKGKGPNGGNSWESKVQPLRDMHFSPDYNGVADKSLIWALALVGLLMIGTACINFVNIATAQALTRSKEVGIRKVVGGNRWQLFRQFMMETGVIVLIALVLACALVNPILPYMSEVVQSELAFNLLVNKQLWLFLALTFVGVTLLSGIYPALVLTGFQPALAVKGKITTQTLGGFNVRRALVVVQFAISQLLIIAAVVMTSQLNFMKTTDLGFNQDAVVVLELPEKDTEKLQTLRNRFLEIKGVEQVSFAGTTPLSGSHNNTNFRFDTRQEDEKWQMTTRPADAEFVEVFDIELAAGRNLQPSDTIREYLLNETAVKKLGLQPEEVIGKKLKVWGVTAPIVGVVKDYYTSSLSQGISPICIMSESGQFGKANLKISTEDVPNTLAAIEKTWSEMNPDNFYDYEFLDERIAKYYEMEAILISLLRFFCGIALFIGCLGLYGLVTFMVARRLKEIGVRKVLGASIPSILGIFGIEFIRLILIAFAIASPLGYFAMNGYLQDYEYAIEIGSWVFLTAIFATTIIAALTVGWHSWRAASVNPSEVLKAE